MAARSASGTWWERNEPSAGRPSTSLGPVQPLGVRSTIIGQRGRPRSPPSRARLWISAISAATSSQRRGHQLVHRGRFIALDEAGRVAVALEQRAQLARGDAREHGRAGDLVAVEVQHREHRAVARRVEELVRVPAAGQRTGFGLAVADHAADEQIGVVEGRPVGVRQRVAELAALVDRAGRLRRGMAGDPAREGELAQQPAQALLVVADVRVDLAVGALEVDVGHQARAAVAGPGDIDHAEVALADQRG